MHSEYYEDLNPNLIETLSIFLMIKIFVFPYGTTTTNSFALILLFILFMLMAYRKYKINSKNINNEIYKNPEQKDNIINFMKKHKISYKLYKENSSKQKNERNVHFNIFYTFFIIFLVSIILEPTIISTIIINII